MRRHFFKEKDETAILKSTLEILSLNHTVESATEQARLEQESKKETNGRNEGKSWAWEMLNNAMNHPVYIGWDMAKPESERTALTHTCPTCLHCFDLCADESYPPCDKWEPWYKGKFYGERFDDEYEYTGEYRVPKIIQEPFVNNLGGVSRYQEHSKDGGVVMSHNGGYRWILRAVPKTKWEPGKEYQWNGIRWDGVQTGKSGKVKLLRPRIENDGFVDILLERGYIYCVSPNHLSPLPEPWIPVANGLAYFMGGIYRKNQACICRTTTISSTAIQIQTLNGTPISDVSIHDLRPVQPSDWQVEILPGIKMEANEDEDGDIDVSVGRYQLMYLIKAEADLFAAGLELLRLANVPVKPFS
jgi:hypothetical protein